MSCEVIVDIRVPICLIPLLFCDLFTIAVTMKLLTAVVATQSKLLPFHCTIFTIHHGLSEAIQSMLFRKYLKKTKKITAYVTFLFQFPSPLV